MNFIEMCMMDVLQDIEKRKPHSKERKKPNDLLKLIRMVGYDYINDMTPNIGPNFLMNLSDTIKFKLIAADVIDKDTFVEVGIDEDYNVFIAFDCEITKESFALGLHLAPEIFIESELSNGTTLICPCPRVVFEEAYYKCGDERWIV